jgi:hypothetical protein
MYAQLPAGTYPKTIYVLPEEEITSLRKRIENEGFIYPFVVKPDVGMKGLLFRVLDNDAAFVAYHRLCPVEYVVQEFVEMPMELSVFYVRHPTAHKGQITGMTYKELLQVRGDGCSTLSQLVDNHDFAKYRREEMERKHQAYWHDVLDEGEIFVLSHAANRNRGARLHNLRDEIDTPLQDLFDGLSQHSGYFFYGRYDLKCHSLEDLRQGRNFSILEYNGCGAAPNHVYHCGLSVWQAWREIIRHWQWLYDISQWNHKHGYPRWPFWKGLRFMRQAQRHFKLLDTLD